VGLDRAGGLARRRRSGGARARSRRLRRPAPVPSRRREAIVVALGGALVLAAYAAIYFPFLPAAAGKLGHDWAYYLPQQLAGLYWLIENGPFAIPWFTPGFCGGVPFYADPNNLYVSLPQALVWGLDPVLAARITLVAFAAAGFVGTYALLRRVFETGAAAAFLGAVLFATNGFFGARLIIGHIGFHSYMLVPAIAYWLLARPRPGDVFASVAAGLAFAYAYQSADVHGVPIAVLALCGLYFIDAWRRGFSWRPPARLAAAAALALALSAAKLSANLSFLASFPRTGYPLPGAQSVLDALRLAAMGLFGAPSSEAAMRVIVNTRFALGRHEFEYGVTWLAPAVIGLGGAIALVRRRWRWNGGRAVAAGGLALVLALPIALNVYAPEWHAVLKRIPVIASSSNLFRWYADYIPLLAVGAALALTRSPGGARSRRARCSRPASSSSTGCPTGPITPSSPIARGPSPPPCGSPAPPGGRRRSTPSLPSPWSTAGRGWGSRGTMRSRWEARSRSATSPCSAIGWSGSRSARCSRDRCSPGSATGRITTSRTRRAMSFPAPTAVGRAITSASTSGPRWSASWPTGRSSSPAPGGSAWPRW